MQPSPILGRPKSGRALDGENCMRMTAGRWQVAAGVVAAVVAAVVLPACSSGSGKQAAARSPSATHRSSTTASTTSTTAAPTTTTTRTPVTAPPGLGRGSSGEAVASIQRRLLDLHYDISAPDGQFGTSTYYAVLAFQKVNGLSRTGRATQDVLDRLNSA